MATQNSIILKPKAIPDNSEPANKTGQQHHRRHRTKNIFKVALFMMRGRSQKLKVVVPVDEESKSVWRKLVGSMRPFHLQSNTSPPRTPQPHNNDKKLKKMVTMPWKTIHHHHHNDDGFESASSEFTSSPSPSRSRYDSAIGLSEMVQDEEEKQKEEENNVVVENEKEENDIVGDGDGDEMIDAKAEEFIAQFYQQMRLQSLDVVDPHYNEISQRSLG